MLRKRSVAILQDTRIVYVVVRGTIPRQICDLISVVVIAIWFKIRAQIIFCAAGLILVGLNGSTSTSASGSM